MSPKNFYSILELDPAATQEDIKKAYRKLVMKCHPDKNHGKENIEIFRNVTEAYEVLTDPVKKESYDKKFSKNDNRKAIKHRHGTNITISLKITVNDIANESIKNIMTTRQVHCPDCAGTGCASKHLSHCAKCSGTGIDLVSSVMGQKKVCLVCKGFGNFPENPNCKKCQGTGLISENFTRQIKIPRDFLPSLLIPKSGNLPQGGDAPGDLIILLIVEKTTGLEIEGRNIKGPLIISPCQAVLGDIIFMDVFGNPVKIVIPAGTKHGDTIQKEDSGISKGNKKGSLILKVIIDIPKKISDEEKSLYTQLLKIQKGYL